MSAIWNWPGSRWWKVDLHAHSPASYDFRPEEDRMARDWARWLQAARDAGIQAVAVTDHDTAGGISGIQEAAKSVAGAPNVFPGVELTASCGTHILVLFDPAKGSLDVDDFLSRADVPVSSRGTSTARSPLSVERILALYKDCPCIFIGAHVNGPAGLLVHEGERRLTELRCLTLAAAEVNPELPFDSRWLDGCIPEVGRRIPVVWGSDAHQFEELGRRFTWVKMTRPDLEGLRLALLDGEDGSLRPATPQEPGDPNAHASLVIESLEVVKAKYLGRPSPFLLSFNPWLNAIIGGRGTGKSTLVDFLRKALRREAELDAVSLRAVFDARLSAAGSKLADGLLTAETRLGVIYRKDGERFRISWDAQGSSSPIVRRTDDGETVEHGDVRERFPVRIYSQKQLFELARSPHALLGLMDDSPQVGGAEFRRQLEALESRYLAKRAEARAVAARAAALPGRRAALADVRRKLEVLQQGGSAQALAAFRLRRQQDSTWRSILGSVESGMDAITAGVERLVVSDLGLDSDAPTEPGNRELTAMHGRLAAVVDALKVRLSESLEEARRELRDDKEGADAQAWAALVASAEVDYQAAVQKLAESGISGPNEYRDLLDQASSLEAEIQGLSVEQERALELDREARSALVSYRELRSSWSDRRGEFARSASSELLQVQVLAHADRDQDDVVACLRRLLGSERFPDDFAHLASRLEPGGENPWSWEALDLLVADLFRLQAEPDASLPPHGAKFLSAVRRSSPEALDRLALYSPDDDVVVQFRDPRQPHGRWKPLAQGSPGQQTAALLAFVLGHGEEPILLDQPEDDLDNTLIYDLVVQRLKETKRSRQVILVTHNPNIVVHGDAELVISLDSRNGQTVLECCGGLQEQAVRDEICEVMEGGRKAFETRFRRIISERGIP